MADGDEFAEGIRALRAWQEQVRGAPKDAPLPTPRPGRYADDLPPPPAARLLSPPAGPIARPVTAQAPVDRDLPQAPIQPPEPGIKRILPPTGRAAQDLDEQIARTRARIEAFQQSAPEQQSFLDKLFVTPAEQLGMVTGLTEKAEARRAAQERGEKRRLARLEMTREGLRPVGVDPLEAQAALATGETLSKVDADLKAKLAKEGMSPRRAMLELARLRYADILGNNDASLPMLEMSNGEAGINLTALENDLTSVFSAYLLQQNPDASWDEIASAREEAERRAKIEVDKLKAMVMDVPFVTEDTRVKDWIMRLPRPARPYVALLAPATTFVERGEITRRDAFNNDPLSYLGRIALSTPWSVAVTLAERAEGSTPLDVIAAGTQAPLDFLAPGSTQIIEAIRKDTVPKGIRGLYEEEGVEELMRGGDLWGAAYQWGKALASALPEGLVPHEREELVAKIFGYGTVIPGILLEPDPTILLGGPLGKAGKAAARAATLGKMVRLETALRKLGIDVVAEIDTIADVAKTNPYEAGQAMKTLARKVVDTLRDEDPALQEAVVLDWMARIGRNAGAPEAVKQIFVNAVPAQKKLEAAQAAMETLLKKNRPVFRAFVWARKEVRRREQIFTTAQKELQKARAKLTKAVRSKNGAKIRQRVRDLRVAARKHADAKARLDVAQDRWTRVNKSTQKARAAHKKAIDRLRKAQKVYVRTAAGLSQDLLKGQNALTSNVPESLARAIGKALEETLENFADSFTSFRGFVESGGEKPFMDAAARVVARSTDTISSGAQNVDPVRFREALDAVPEDVLRAVIEGHAHGGLLWRVFSGGLQKPPAAGTPLTTGVTDTLVALSPEERAGLEAALDALVTTARNQRRLAGGQARAEAVMSAVKGQQYKQTASFLRDLFPSVPRFVDQTVALAQNRVRWLRGIFRPDASRVGVLDKEMAQVYKAFDLVLTQFRAELMEVDVTDLDTLVKFADSVDPIEHARGATISNRFFGPVTVWQKCRQHLLDGFRLADAAAAGTIPGVGKEIDTEVQTSLESLARMWYSGDAPQDVAESLRLAARQLLENGDWSGTFEDFARNLRRIYTDGTLPDGKRVVLVSANGKRYVMPTVGTADTREHRSMLQGLMAVYRAAMLDYANEMVIRSFSWQISVNEARRINETLGRSAARLGLDADGKIDLGAAAGEFEVALNGLLRLGMPFLENKVTIYRALKGSQDGFKQLVALSLKEDGTTTFLPRTILRQINESIGIIVREFESQSRTNTTLFQWLGQRLSTLFTWLKTSWTIGLLSPLPRHGMSNIAIGDPLGQVLPFFGAGQAGRQMVSGLAAQLPLFNRAVALASRRMSTAARARFKALGDVPVLGPVLHAAFRPDVSALFTGGDGTLVLGGNLYTHEQLRQMIMEDGILQSVVHEEVTKMVSLRAQRAGFFPRLADAAKAWQHEIASHVEMGSQRQRVAFYLDLLQRGATRQEARDATMKALYDWKHGYAEWETSLLLSINVPFYRWARHAHVQAGSMLLEPFVNPERATRNAIFGLTPVGYSVKMDRLRDGVAQWSMVGLEDDEESYRTAGRRLSELDRLGTLAAPRAWYTNRFWISATPSDNRRIWWKEQGKDVTHSVSAFYPITPLETLNTLLGAMALPVLFLLDALPGSPIHTTPNAIEQLFLDNALDQLGPSKEIWQATGLDTPEGDRMTWVRPEEAKFLMMWDRMRPWSKDLTGPDGWLDSGVDQNPETGRWYARRSFVRMMRVTPFALQIPSYIRAIHEGQIAAYGESRVLPRYVKFATAVFSDLYGLRRVTDINVYEEQRRNVREATRALDALESLYIDTWGPPPEIVR